METMKILDEVSLLKNGCDVLTLIKFCSFLCLGGFSQVVLTQSDPVLKAPGEAHKLTCAVPGFNVNSYWMEWVRQKPGQGWEWLVHYYDSGNKYYLPTIQGRFTASKDISNFYLLMNNLKTEDTAVYYCARDTVTGFLRDLMQKLFLE
uniref:Ig-like domain-containing protein n=1 Tax=Laticauda laticaudata TaxID=8630 RepID=A0A8C5SK50_LATLA